MRIAVVATVVCLSVVGLSVAADVEAAMRKPTDIPAQALHPALQKLSKDRDFQLVFRTDLVGELRTGGAVGDLTLDEALKQLLKGTDLTYTYLDEKTVTIIPVGSAPLTDSTGESPASPNAQPPPAAEGSNVAFDNFRVAQLDQGPTSSPSTVEKSPEQASERKKTEQLQEVVVTGSRIPITAKEGAQEVRVYTKEQIEQSGQTTIADFLSTLPDVSMSSIESGEYGNYADQTTVRLHGLPQGTTLVLLNGRRVEINNYGFFDLNNIPVSAIERVEVLPVGSSAIYGADSLAGAVNIILRKNFDGFEAETKYGHADSLGETDASLAWGASAERGALSIIGSYQDHGGVLAAQRSVTATPNSVMAAFGLVDSCQPGTVYSLNGGNLPGLSSPMAAIPTGLSGKPSIASFNSTAGVVNKCSFNRDDDILSPLKRTGVLASAHYDLSDHVTVFSEFMLSHEDVTSRIGDLFTLYNTFGSTLPASNAFNPFGQNVGISYSYSGLADDYLRTTTFSRPLIGVRGLLFGDWSYELVEFLSKDQSRVDQNDNYDRAALQAALASSDLATALNPFASGAPGSTQLLTSVFIAPPSILRFNSQNITTEATLHGPLFSLPSGSVQAVFGAESDESKIHTETHDVGTSAPPVTNRRSAYSLFTEERVPLWANHENPANGEKLALTLAGRFDHTNDYGNKSTGQGGLEWRPIESLLIRAGYATSYEAPQLTQLDGAPTSYNATGYSDPFRNNEAVTSILVLSGPNPALKPETGNSKQFGIVYSSNALVGLQASITYWAINISNYITIPSIQDLIDYPNLFPGAVTRAPPSAQDTANGVPGHIISVADINANFGALDVAGIDFDFRYATHTSAGEFTPSVTVTETSRYDRALQPSLPAVSYVSQASLDGFAPRWKGTLAFSWKAGPYATNFAGRYVGRYRDYQDYLPNTNELGNFWLFDANLRYGAGQIFARDNRWLAGAYVEIGAVNLLNKLPQYSNNFSGFDPAESDIRGRFLYARLGVRF